MVPLDDVERLSRYLAGELSPDEARALQLELSRTPALALALARLERLDALVAALPAVSPADVEAARVAMAPRRPRARWAVPVALAVAAAVAVLLLRAPDPVPPPTLHRAVAGDALTAGAALVRADLDGAEVVVAPFSHVVVVDGATVRLEAGSVLVRGTARVVAERFSALAEGVLVVSTEPARVLADVTGLHPMNEDIISMERWQTQARSWAPTGLVALVLLGSAQVSAGDEHAVLSAGQAWSTPPPDASTKPPAVAAPEAQVVKAVAALTDQTPRPAELVDFARLNAGVRQHERALMQCLAGRPVGDTGQVVTLLTHANEGGRMRLAEATVSADAPVDPLAASCVLGVLQRVDLPTPVGSNLVQVRYPIAFSRRGEGSFLLLLPAPPGALSPGLLPARPDVVDVRVGRSPVVGPADARVTVVLFTELECAFCARAHDTFKRLRAWARHKPVRFVYKHLPLDAHPFAREASRHLVAAHEQGRFWDFLDRAQEQRVRTSAGLENVALGLSLDLARYRAAVTSPATEERVQEDLDEARRLGAKAVPTWYVDGVELVGARADADLLNAISEALRRPPAPRGPRAPRE
ncbi:MAG: thioredoxin domain-containing protein [Myxococcaceae bacterium]|nr:thioredoxin domain-containing protein [Myxococcaceae bacterium]